MSAGVGVRMSDSLSRSVAFSPANSSMSLLMLSLEATEMPGTMEYQIILPLIIFFGLAGNSLSLFTIFHSRLRHIPANQYLIVLTSADSVFLFFVGMLALKIDLTSYEACATIEYFLMSSSYVSSWATTALTIERYIALVHPMLQLRLAHESRVRMMLLWVPIPFVLHLLQFINLVPGGPNERPCVLREGGYQIYVELLDALLCYGIPCTLVVLLNALVACTMKKARRQFSRISSPTRMDSRRSAGTASGARQEGALTILWVVPMTFVLLNTPFYLVRIVDIISPSDELTTWHMLIHNTTHYLYYFNFACDVVVYAFSSSNFRRTAVHTLRKMLWKRSSRRDQKPATGAFTSVAIEHSRSALEVNSSEQVATAHERLTTLGDVREELMSERRAATSL